jgi:hypothetical protein
VRSFGGEVAGQITIWFYPERLGEIPIIEIHLMRVQNRIHFCLEIVREQFKTRYQRDKRYKQIVTTWPAWLAGYPDWEVEIMELLL